MKPNYSCFSAFDAQAGNNTGLLNTPKFCGLNNSCSWFYYTVPKWPEANYSSTGRGSAGIHPTWNSGWAQPVLLRTLQKEMWRTEGDCGESRGRESRSKTATFWSFVFLYPHRVWDFCTFLTCWRSSWSVLILITPLCTASSSTTAWLSPKSSTWVHSLMWKMRWATVNNGLQPLSDLHKINPSSDFCGLCLLW